MQMRSLGVQVPASVSSRHAPSEQSSFAAHAVTTHREPSLSHVLNALSVAHTDSPAVQRSSAAVLHAPLVHSSPGAQVKGIQPEPSEGQTRPTDTVRHSAASALHELSSFEVSEGESATVSVSASVSSVSVLSLLHAAASHSEASRIMPVFKNVCFFIVFPLCFLCILPSVLDIGRRLKKFVLNNLYFVCKIIQILNFFCVHFFIEAIVKSAGNVQKK
jgi:hypothetical protein